MPDKDKEALIEQLDKILSKLSKDLETSQGKETTKILKKLDATLDERLKLMD